MYKNNIHKIKNKNDIEQFLRVLNNNVLNLSLSKLQKIKNNIQNKPSFINYDNNNFSNLNDNNSITNLENQYNQNNNNFMSKREIGNQMEQKYQDLMNKRNYESNEPKRPSTPDFSLDGSGKKTNTQQNEILPQNNDTFDNIDALFSANITNNPDNNFAINNNNKINGDVERNLQKMMNDRNYSSEPPKQEKQNNNNINEIIQMQKIMENTQYNEQPKTQYIDLSNMQYQREQPNMQYQREQPKTQYIDLSNVQPNTHYQREQPNIQYQREQPNMQYQREQPNMQYQREQPKTQYIDLSNIQYQREQPNTQYQREQPNTQYQREQPNSQYMGQQINNNNNILEQKISKIQMENKDDYNILSNKLNKYNEKNNEILKKINNLEENILNKLNSNNENKELDLIKKEKNKVKDLMKQLIDKQKNIKKDIDILTEEKKSLLNINEKIITINVNKNNFIYNLSDKIHNIEKINLISYNIQKNIYNINDNNSTFFYYKDEEKTFSIVNGYYSINNLIDELNNNDDNIIFKLNEITKKVEIYCDCEISIYNKENSILKTLGFTKNEYLDSDNFIAEDLYDLRVNNVAKIYLDNIVEKPYVIDLDVDNYKINKEVSINNLDKIHISYNNINNNNFNLTFSIIYNSKKTNTVTFDLVKNLQINDSESEVDEPYKLNDNVKIL